MKIIVAIKQVPAREVIVLCAGPERAATSIREALDLATLETLSEAVPDSPASHAGAVPLNCIYLSAQKKETHMLRGAPLQSAAKL